jgi:hypothetical protein
VGDAGGRGGIGWILVLLAVAIVIFLALRGRRRGRASV